MEKIHFYFQQIFLERANLFIIHHHHSAISLYTASRGFSFACILAFTKSLASLVSCHRICKILPINSLFIMRHAN